MKKLFLDDERTPEQVHWVSIPEGPYDIVRSYHQFSHYLRDNGVPDFISFDFNLGWGAVGNGEWCVDMLIRLVKTKRISWNPNFQYEVHSCDQESQAVSSMRFKLETFILEMEGVVSS